MAVRTLTAEFNLEGETRARARVEVPVTKELARRVNGTLVAMNLLGHTKVVLPCGEFDTVMYEPDPADDQSVEGGVERLWLLLHGTIIDGDLQEVRLGMEAWNFDYETGFSNETWKLPKYKIPRTDKYPISLSNHAPFPEGWGAVDSSDIMISRSSDIIYILFDDDRWSRIGTTVRLMEELQQSRVVMPLSTKECCLKDESKEPRLVTYYNDARRFSLNFERAGRPGHWGIRVWG